MDVYHNHIYAQTLSIMLHDASTCNSESIMCSSLSCESSQITTSRLSFSIWILYVSMISKSAVRVRPLHLRRLLVPSPTILYSLMRFLGDNKLARAPRISHLINHRNPEEGSQPWQPLPRSHFLPLPLSPTNLDSTSICLVP